MSFISHTRWLIVASCLLASACTEKTIVREVPASSPDASTTYEITEEQTPTILPDPDDGNASGISPVIGVPVETTQTSNMVDETDVLNTQTSQLSTETEVVDASIVETNTETTNTDTDTDTESTVLTQQTENGNLNSTDSDNILLSDTTDTQVEANPVTANPELPTTSEPAIVDLDLPTTSEPATADLDLPTTSESISVDTETPTTVGDPGMSVDCQQALPCRWVSEDTQFTVTVTNADNIGMQERLAVEYSILTSHDSQISIASTETAKDDAGETYEASALSLGTGIGGALQGVLAGSTIPARIEFDRSSGASSLASWSIGLSDTGLVRQPQFTGIPIGSATNQIADCNNALPCVWESPDGDVTITLILANGFGTTNRLSTNFKVESTRNAVVAVDSGATAVGADGLRYKGRTHAIGVETSAQKITANLIAGAHVAGTIFFSRTQSMSTTLQNLSLMVYEDRPVPRWNPKFTSVPIQ